MAKKLIDNNISKVENMKHEKKFAFTKALISDNEVKVVMSKEIQDRDGEVLSVSGCDLENYKKNPVVLWGHRMNSGDVEDVMGRMIDVEKTIGVDGIPELQGVVEFADHPKAQYLKRMVKQGIISTVSVGFGIKNFDAETKTITDWELYELSFVNVPANTEARVTEKSIKEASEDFSEKVYKKLSNYEVIHPMIKEYRRLFLKDEELLEELGVEKSGSELVDVKTIYEAIKNLINKTKEPEESKEDQEVQEETPAETNEPMENPEDEPVTKSDLKEFLTSLGIEQE